MGSGGVRDIHLKDVPADALRWVAQVVGRGRQLACAVVQGRSWWCVPKRCRMNYGAASSGVFYSCLGHREGAYNPCPKWARIYRLMTESGSKAFPASRAPEV